MRLGPELKGGVQGHAVAQVGRPKLREAYPVVPHFTLGNQSHAQDTIRKKQLNALRHVRVESLNSGLASLSEE